MPSESEEMLRFFDLLLETTAQVGGFVLFLWYSYCLYRHVPGQGSLRREMIGPRWVKLTLALWILAAIGVALVRLEIGRRGWSID
jgi:hypothetical protein